MEKTMTLSKTALVGKFYYSLAQLQIRAINYVASGETEEVKLDRISELVKITEDAVVKIGFERECPASSDIANCEPPCYVDKNMCMCMCDHEANPF